MNKERTPRASTLCSLAAALLISSCGPNSRECDSNMSSTVPDNLVQTPRSTTPMKCDMPPHGIQQPEKSSLDSAHAWLDEPKEDFPVDAIALLLKSSDQTSVDKNELVVRLHDDTLAEVYERPCKGTLFSPYENQPRAEGCTATLIDTDKVLTAAHCSKPEKIAHSYLVFGRTIRADFVGSTDQREVRVPKNHWAKVECILAADITRTGTPGDWAVLQLDREMAFAPRPLVDDNPSGCIEAPGYPLGLPLKVTHGQLGQGRADTAYLDVAPGMSGAPLLTKSHEIIGVHRGRAERDGSEPRPSGNVCIAPRWCESPKCVGTVFTPVEDFRNWKPGDVHQRFLAKFDPNNQHAGAVCPHNPTD